LFLSLTPGSFVVNQTPLQSSTWFPKNECCFAKEKKNVIRSIKTTENKTGVSHFDLAIYIRKYLKAKERES
jgi:hypothetical protein